MLPASDVCLSRGVGTARPSEKVAFLAWCQMVPNAKRHLVPDAHFLAQVRKSGFLIFVLLPAERYTAGSNKRPLNKYTYRTYGRRVGGPGRPVAS